MTENPQEQAVELAFLYHPSMYSKSRIGPSGSQQYATSLAQAFINVGAPNAVTCLAQAEDMFKEFAALIEPYARKETRCSWLKLQEFTKLKQIGALFNPSPALAKLAWQRRHFGNRAYSIIGVAYRLSHFLVQDALADLVTGPMEPWDALVCPWQSTKKAALRELSAYAEYLKERFDIKRDVRLGLQLPVIHPFVRIPEPIDQEVGLELRNKLSIEPSEPVVLSVGRFSPLTKASPLPLFLSLQRAAEQTGKKVHLLLAGWFEPEAISQEYIRTALEIAPSLSVHILDGRNEETLKAVWSAADIYTELSDNTQESFGLTVLEAMANSLPVVLSDWAFNREIVEEGKSGLLIPTTGPVPGLTDDLTLLSSLSLMDYESHVGLASQFVSVDVSQAAKAYSELIENKEKRSELGKNARAVVAARFNANLVIRQYCHLIGELGRLRREPVNEPAPAKRSLFTYPTRLDTAVMFAEYSSATLSPESILRLQGSADDLKDLVGRLESLYFGAIAKSMLLPLAELRKLIELIGDKGQCALSDVTLLYSSAQGKALLLSVLWLSKVGCIEIEQRAMVVV